MKNLKLNLMKIMYISNAFGVATYENSKIRFKLIEILISFFSYKVIPIKHSYVGCCCNDPSSLQDSMYYEWIYDVQNTTINFPHQMIFCLLIFKDSLVLRKMYHLEKNDRGSIGKGFNFLHYTLHK